MSYFSRRNQYISEYSGNEEVSIKLRKRIISVISKYIEERSIVGDPYDSYFIDKDDFIHTVTQEFPSEDPFEIVSKGDFHKVFTIVEIFLDMLSNVSGVNQQNALIELVDAFRLSGSVYKISSHGTIELKVDKDVAEKLEQTKKVLQDTPSAYNRFFEAVSNLIRRKAKPEDIVKDIFVATEDYLKTLTGTSDYDAAVKELLKQGVIRREQKAILEKLYAFRSDSIGVGHAGSSPVPTELEALWFIETISAQLRFIYNQKLKLMKGEVRV
ncbi:MAG: hypothetical protein Q8P20_01675 [bacterium]|nr:hypothetical protein [bacterium]